MEMVLPSLLSAWFHLLVIVLSVSLTNCSWWRDLEGALHASALFCSTLKVLPVLWRLKRGAVR